LDAKFDQIEKTLYVNKVLTRNFFFCHLRTNQHIPQQSLQ